MKLRLEIAPGDHFDAEIKPFDTLTVEEHIRLYESDEKDETPWQRLARITGAPMRFVRIMKVEEVDEAFRVIQAQTDANARALSAMAKVNETLKNWAEEHDGKAWTVEDARAVMKDHEVFRDHVEVEGLTFTAPDVEPSPFGKWIDLQGAMNTNEDAKDAESVSYVRALAIMMEGEDGPYPSQANDESDKDYTQRCVAYTTTRHRLFMRAPWVDVMGCAAFFFSKWPRFALLCAHNMTLFRSLMKPNQRPERRVIPIGGEHLPN